MWHGGTVAQCTKPGAVCPGAQRLLQRTGARATPVAGILLASSQASGLGGGPRKPATLPTGLFKRAGTTRHQSGAVAFDRAYAASPSRLNSYIRLTIRESEARERAECQRQGAQNASARGASEHSHLTASVG